MSFLYIFIVDIRVSNLKKIFCKQFDVVSIFLLLILGSPIKQKKNFVNSLMSFLYISIVDIRVSN